MKIFLQPISCWAQLILAELEHSGAKLHACLDFKKVTSP